jgi:phage shock protein A
MQAQYDIEHAIEKFESYERKIEDLEAQVEAYDVVSEASALEQQFAALEKDDNIEAELMRLTAVMQAKTATSTQGVA